MRFAANPALDRLNWVLDGMDATPGWGADVAEVLVPEFAAVISSEDYRQRISARAQTHAPVQVVAVSTGTGWARAEVRRVDGELDMVGVEVEIEAPHRIISSWVSGLIPDDLGERLPMAFTIENSPSAAVDSRLIVFSGVPGTGKSTLADAVGRALAVPVFATDWLLGALTPFGGYHRDQLLETGEELLTTLAVRQVALGQSAILDAPSESPATRERWLSLAASSGCSVRVVHCVCSDAGLHRHRVESRQRNIPGWHDAADWADVRTRSVAFPAWNDAAPVLIVDAVRPVSDNLAAVLAFLS